MKLAIFLLLSIFSASVVGEEYTQQELNELQAEYCNRTAVEADVSKDIFEAGMYSNILIQLLSGNSEGAIESLSNELAIKVIFLGKAITEKPCNINQKALKRIYPMLRVVAAVHENTPINALSKNEAALQVLQQAIKDNPHHYKKTLERSRHWKDGIK
jgi:hypothetical protein